LLSFGPGVNLCSTDELTPNLLLSAGYVLEEVANYIWCFVHDDALMLWCILWACELVDHLMAYGLVCFYTCVSNYDAW